jgi:hypothetical protein
VHQASGHHDGAAAIAQAGERTLHGSQDRASQRDGWGRGNTGTLYNLMAALQDVVGLEDDALIMATVVHLLRFGRLTGLGTACT